MKNVASLAMELSKKPSRKVAFESVQSLIEKLADEQDQQSFKAADLANLYAYFLPSKPKTAKNDLEWVSKAVAVKDVRYYLNYLHEASGKLVGTDGHRMHWIETKQDRGYLAPMTGDVVSCDGTYPNIERVIPHHLSPTHVLRVSELGKSSVIPSKGRPIPQYIFPNGSKFNAQFIDEAVNGADEFLWNPQQDAGFSIYISSLDGVRNAVIMPMRD